MKLFLSAGCGSARLYTQHRSREKQSLRVQGQPGLPTKTLSTSRHTQTQMDRVNYHLFVCLELRVGGTPIGLSSWFRFCHWSGQPREHLCPLISASFAGFLSLSLLEGKHLNQGTPRGHLWGHSASENSGPLLQLLLERPSVGFSQDTWLSLLWVAARP